MSDKQFARLNSLLKWSNEAMYLGDLDSVAMYQTEIRLIIASIL